MPTPNEDRFIAFWRANVIDDHVHPGWMKGLTEAEIRVVERAVVNRLVEGPEPVNDPSVRGACLKLTPRGADLLATADAIGYEPPTSKRKEWEPVPGEYVTVRPEHRRQFRKDTAAAQGKPLKVNGPDGGAWSIGPKSLDYAYDYELQPCTIEPCSRCKGKGRVPVSRSSNRSIVELLHDEPATVVTLPGWDMSCPDCRGEKVVPVTCALTDRKRIFNDIQRFQAYNPEYRTAGPWSFTYAGPVRFNKQ